MNKNANALFLHDEEDPAVTVRQGSYSSKRPNAGHAAAASVPEVGVLGGEDGQELVDRDAELQIPPRHEEL